MAQIERDFAEKMLELHNESRCSLRHLRWSRELIDYCKKRVKAIAEEDIVSEGHLYSENIFQSRVPGFPLTAAKVFKLWTKCQGLIEIQRTRSSGFGMAAAVSKSQMVYVVAAYKQSENNLAVNFSPLHVGPTKKLRNNATPYLHKQNMYNDVIIAQNELIEDAKRQDQEILDKLEQLKITLNIRRKT